MTIRHLKIFISVCETGSITKTAGIMNVAQPAVSQTIKELEKYYSINLFFRMNRKLILTEHGKKLFIKAKDLVENFNEFESLAYELTLNPSLKIGFTLTNSTNNLDLLMSYVKNKHKNVSLYTYVNNTNEIIDKICNGDLDLGVIEGFTNNPVIQSKELYSDKLLVVCGKEFKCSKVIDLKELSNLPLLLREKGSSSRDRLDKLCEITNTKINPIMESISNHAIINATIQCNGVAILPRVLVQSEIDRGLLKVIEISNLQLNNTSSLIWHKGRIFNNQIEDIIKNCLIY